MASWTEFFLLVLMVAFAGFSTRVNSKQWLFIDAALAFAFGACTIPFAVKSQEMQTTGVAVDHQHSYLCNVYICHCLMTAIATVLLRKSDDPTTTTALLLSRTVGIGLATLFITFGHFHSSIFNSLHLYYGVLGNAAWAAVNAYHLYCRDSTNKQGKPSRVDLFLKVDIGLTFGYAFPHILMPESALATATGMKPDYLHKHLLQVGGGVHIGTAALSYMALQFTSQEQKKAVLISRITVLVLMFMVRTYSWLILEPSTSLFAYSMACTGYLPVIPAYLGIMANI